MAATAAEMAWGAGRVNGETRGGRVFYAGGSVEGAALHGGGGLQQRPLGSSAGARRAPPSRRRGPAAAAAAAPVCIRGRAARPPCGSSPTLRGGSPPARAAGAHPGPGQALQRVVAGAVLSDRHQRWQVFPRLAEMSLKSFDESRGAAAERGSDQGPNACAAPAAGAGGADSRGTQRGFRAARRRAAEVERTLALQLCSSAERLSAATYQGSGAPPRAPAVGRPRVRTCTRTLRVQGRGRGTTAGARQLVRPALCIAHIV